MKVFVVFLLVAAFAVTAQDNGGETTQAARGELSDKTCLIHYECKHYKWFCYRSEYAFCIDNKCQCLPRYHFGYRHPYRHLRP